MAAPVRVEWSPRALRDLLAIYRTTAADNRQAAAAQNEHILDHAQALAAHPRLGKASRWRGRRVLILTHYPYSIYYRGFRDGVRIVRVVHQRRHFP